jgi:autotransporter translocation and assembly factor TamB
VRGQFTFAGKCFTLDDSTITLDGAIKGYLVLDIRAVNDAGDETALVLITGRSSDP